mgnify:CR=1 FL=1
MNSRKLALMGLILALLGSFFVFDLGQYLNLDTLKAQQAAPPCPKRPALWICGRWPVGHRAACRGKV